MAKSKRFKLVEKKAKDTPLGDIENLKWEGEELQAESKTKITEDTGVGQAIVLRFFEFGANPESFKIHKPTAQELFNSHLKGIESLLWRDGLKFYHDTPPRLMFSKDSKKYCFIIPCTTTRGSLLTQKTQTLSEILTPR